MEYVKSTGLPKREFPVVMVKGGQAVRVDTEAQVVQYEWDGFAVQESQPAEAKAVESEGVTEAKAQAKSGK